MKVTLSNCSDAAMNGFVTRSIIIRSLKGKTPETLNGSTTINIPSCSISPTTISLSSLQIPETNLATTEYASEYEWVLPNGWKDSDGYSGTIRTTEPSISVVPPLNDCSSPQIKVRAYTECSQGEPSNYLTLNVQRTPTSLNISPSYTAKCDVTGEVTFSVEDIPCATYSWTYPSNWQLVGNSINNDVIVLKPNGKNGGTVTASASFCNKTLTATSTIGFDNSVAKPTFTNPVSQLCPNTTRTFNVSVASGNPNSYTWTTTGGIRVNGQTSVTTTTPSVNVSVLSTASGNASLSVTANNSCGGTSATTIQNIYIGIPTTITGFDVREITGNGSLCYFPYTEYKIKGATGATNYTWTTSPANIVNLTILDGGRTCRVRKMEENFSASFYLKAEASNPCGNSSFQRYVTYQTRSYEECRTIGFSISLYPNPTKDYAEIVFQDDMNSIQNLEELGIDEYEIAILNAWGQMKKTLKGNTLVTRINVIDLPKGMYFVRIVHSKGNEKLKLFIE
ncbi:MAG: hypothetical protein OHK0038_26870 [Flammeovirgaceae bacterium]